MNMTYVDLAFCLNHFFLLNIVHAHNFENYDLVGTLPTTEKKNKVFLVF